MQGRDTTLRNASVDDLRAWWVDQPQTPATRNQYRTALVGYFDWLIETGQRDDNPAEELPTISEPRQVTRALTPDQTRAVLEASESFRPIYRTAIVVMLHTGLRVTECRTLEWSAVSGEWLVVTGKGSHERQIPLHPRAQKALTSWRGRCDSARWVFPSPRQWDQPVSYTALWRRFQQLSDHLGLDLSPHVCRHSFASRMLEQCGDVRAVQETLGHESLKTTERYLSVRPVKLQEAVNSLDWGR